MSAAHRVAVFAALGLAAAAGASRAAQDAGHVHAEHEQGAAQARTPIPALTDADRRDAVPPATAHLHAGESLHGNTLINRMEFWDAGKGTGVRWDAEGWIGTDINRLWWRGEGEHAEAHTEAASLEVLFGHSFAPRWDWVAGMRQEARPRESRSFIAFGVQGLAPQWFEVSAMAFVGEGGRTALRLDVEYTLRFSNRLVLQPMLELQLHGKDDPSRGIGNGLGTVETGLRLRYEVSRQFAPYLGVAWERGYGNTARLRRDIGKPVGDVQAVAGLRLWF